MATRRTNNQRAISVRLGSFALVLAGTFGSAYAIGERLPGHNHSADSMNHQSHGAAVAPTEAAFEMNGYQLVTEQIATNGATFHLLDTNGDTVTNFAKSHGAFLHTILVRPDLSGFQHVHPAINADGSWTVPITEPGQWHMVFEATPIAGGTPLTQSIIVAANIDDETVVAATPLPPAADIVEIDGLVVTRHGFEFTVSNTDGTAATDLEPYLEQVAHLVALRQGDLAFTHLHPLDSAVGTFDFGQGVVAPGTYRLFLQFGHAGVVLTVPFTVVIS